MDYFTGSRGTTMTAQRAERLMIDHSVSMTEFYAEFGVHESYPVSRVAAWLGY